MNKKFFAGLISAAAVLSACGMMVFADEGGVEINSTNFPDENFRAYVASEAIDTNQDGCLSNDEISAVKKIIVNDKHIATLEGIEVFTGLEELQCTNNDLTALDVSGCTSLRSLDCFDNENLETLTLGSNTALEELYCFECNFSTLDFSGCVNLQEINCAENDLTTIDVTNLTELNFLNCNNNKINNLDVSDLTKLDDLRCENNALTSIDVSGCTALVNFECPENNLTTLDISDCTDLKYLDCSENNLTNLSIYNNTALKILLCEKNQIEKLSVYNNPILKSLFENNEREEYSEEAYYTEDFCISPSTVITLDLPVVSEVFPDDGFRTYISSALDTDSDGFLSESEIANVTEIDVRNFTPHINSLEGIEYFKSLTILDCGGNCITSLDLSGLTSLEICICSFNRISSLNIKGCTSLNTLDCYKNNLTNLDLSSNSALENLDCVGNNISTLSIANNPIILGYYTDTPYAISEDDMDILVYGVEITEAEYNQRIKNDELCITCKINGQTKYFSNALLTDASTVIQTSTVTPTATPTVTPTATPVPTQAPTSGMVAFAERLYTEALNRNYDKAGRDYWVSQLRSGVSGAEVARQFFFSEEFVDADLSDSVFVDRLYGTFMNRAADEGGKTYWLSQLSSGAMTREDVFNGFINSPEWANICLRCGIVSGGTQAPTITVEPSAEVTAFATRLYTTCLGREADSTGVTWWANELANMRRTGTTAAQGFFFSDEYVSAGHSDAEFVTALYRTFMGRESDQAGYDYWMSELSNGCTRENVLERFAGCDEFGNICADAGIIR